MEKKLLFLCEKKAVTCIRSDAQQVLNRMPKFIKIKLSRGKAKEKETLAVGGC